MEQEYRYKVCVRCFTFNHAPYIVNALNGFTMQQTSFPFVCTIVDDHSSDGEPEVISRYVEEHFDLEDPTTVRRKETDDYRLVFARHKTNSNCYFAVFYLKYNHYSIKKPKMVYLEEWTTGVPYTAICEGDDYWIDPAKLQKQTVVLDKMSGVTLCGTNGLTLWDKGIMPPRYFNRIFASRMVNPSEVIGHWLFPTASLFFRSNVRENWPSWTKKIYGGDQSLILVALSKGDLYALEECTCIYRQNFNNKDSASNRNRASGNWSVRYHENQALLYEEYDKYTEGRFSQFTAPVVEQHKKMHRFFALKKKSTLLALMCHPVMFSRIAWSVVSKRLKYMQ